MNTKKLLTCLACLLLAACGDEPSAEAAETGQMQQQADGGPANPQAAQQWSAAGGLQQASSRSSGKRKLHPVYDPNFGMVSVSLPFPEQWQIHAQRAANAPAITGPRGLEVYDLPFQSFMYTNDPQMQQIYRQSGQQLRPMPGVEALIQQDVVPWAKQQGLTLVRSYEVPEISKIDNWYQQQLYQSVPMQKQNVAIGSDWKNAEGELFFLLMHIGQSVSNGLQNWSYYSQGLQAERAYFEEAKQHLIYGYANAQYNPAQIQAYNQSEAQKAGQSWAAHNQRMRSNQANFEASQRAIVGANNAVNDSIMQGWRDRNAIQDRGQKQFVDSISERTTMVNPSNGQQWEVDAGANNYWINNDGEYLPTDDYNYNPNTDPNLYDQQWQQLENEYQ